MNDLYIDTQTYPISKFGIFSALKRKIHKRDVLDLIESIKDEKLIRTIKYIYNIQGDLVPYDLAKIRDEVNQLLNHHYDCKIKGNPTALGDEQVEALNEAIEKIRLLLAKYYQVHPNKD